MFDVFLSHNSRDKPAVRELKRLLVARGLRVWLDEDELMPGEHWQSGLVRAIANSAAVAVCIGPAGVGPWEDEEMQAALGLAVKDRRRVIPLALPETPETSEISLFLANRTWVDLRGGFTEEGIRRVVWGVTGRKPAGLEPSCQCADMQGGQSKGGGIFRHAPEKLIGRDVELAALDRFWNDLATRVVTLVAWGGVGKTSLVAHWMVNRDVWNRPDFEQVYVWSFYSQGTREQSTASADTFIGAALEFFGGEEGRKLAGSPASSWVKGLHLAQRVGRRRTLLVLDGVEPLQYPPGPMGGRLKDPALEALLTGLAQHNSGLCIVTTREPVTDLAPFRGTVSPEWRLEHLVLEAGAELLFQMGVKRAGNRRIKADDKELKDAAGEVRGHALTLRLLGRYLAKCHNGDVRKRNLICFEQADEKIEGGHAFKVMAAYEKWLAGGGEEGMRQLAVLRLLGLFDRPADAGSLTALCREPVIEGLTEPLVGLGDSDWNYTLSNLVECGLISCRESPSGISNVRPAIDCHPLIREHFARRLCGQNPEGWRAAHRRLYEYLRSSVRPRRRPTLEELLPLCHSVAHACEAGLALEAYAEVYRRRIVREHHDYLSSHLGAATTEERLLDLLGAGRGFASFTAEHKAFLNRQWGLTLRKLGKVELAVPCFVAALDNYVAVEKWDRAVNAGRHLGQSHLLAGDLKAADESARAAVRMTGKGVTSRERIAAMAGLAHVLHQYGDNARAKKLFEKAELDPARRRLGFLRHLPGVRYCDLLLDSAERAMWRQMLGVKTGRRIGPHANLIERSREVERRARQARGVSRTHGMRVRTGLNLLSLGRAVFCRTLLTPAGRKAGSLLESACRYLDDAVLELQHAGEMDFQPNALLARAWCSFVKAQGHDRRGDHGQATACRASAKADLDRAWQIAERGPMRLHLADVHLYRARLFHAEKPYPWDRDEQGRPRGPRDDLAAARKLIEQCGYRRRDWELADAEEAAKSW